MSRDPIASSEIRSHWASAGATWAAAALSWSLGASSAWASGDASWRRALVSWAAATRLWAFHGESWAASAEWFLACAHQSWVWVDAATEWGCEAMAWARGPRDWDSSPLRWADVVSIHALAREESAKLVPWSCVTAATGPDQFPPPLNANERPKEVNEASALMGLRGLLTQTTTWCLVCWFLIKWSPVLCSPFVQMSRCGALLLPASHR